MACTILVTEAYRLTCAQLFGPVSRLVCESENYEMEMHVDVNTQLYPVDVGNKYTIVLASSISEDDTAEKGYVWVECTCLASFELPGDLLM